MKGNEINCYKQSKTFCLPVAPGANYQTEDVPSGRKAGVAGINTNSHQYHLPAWVLRNGWCCPLFQPPAWTQLITTSQVSVTGPTMKILVDGSFPRAGSGWGFRGRQSRTHPKDGCLVPNPLLTVSLLYTMSRDL